MKELALELKKNGFTYRQFDRNAYKAIYSQFCHDAKKIIAYEVFHVKSHNGYEIQGNYIEPAEMYPSNESFGVSAWSIKDKDDALTKYVSLQPRKAELGV